MSESHNYLIHPQPMLPTRQFQSQANAKKFTRLPSGLWLAAGVILLLAFFVTRMYHLLALPLFMDEATHLTRAQAAWQGHPFDLLLTGKAFAPYLAAIFNPFVGAPFIGRYVVVAIGAIGLASAIGLGRALHSRVAGVLTGALWLLCPYLFFYERMALVDATLAALATFSAWAAVRMIRTGKVWDAVLCGVGLALCPFAKTTGVIYLVIPAAAILLPACRTWVERVRQSAIAYIVTAALVALPALYIVSQGANVFGLGDLASADVHSLGDRLAQNPVLTLTAFGNYFTPLFLLILTLAALLGLLMRPRRGALVLTLVAVPLSALIVVASQLYLRYLVIAVPGLLLLAAFGLTDLADNLSNLKSLNRIRLLPWAVIGIGVGAWAILFAVPFMWTAYHDPAALHLPDNDQDEYIVGWTSGYGLRDAAVDLLKRAQASGQPVTAIGMIASCNTIRLYVPLYTSVTVQCPDVWDPTGAGMAQGASEINQQLVEHGAALVVGEEHGPVALNAVPQPNMVLKTFDRPGASIYNVELFQVSASGEGPNPGQSH
ncbi:MAG: ArnT family glycosyltransferase [Aggregatilineales bacterium]